MHARGTERLPGTRGRCTGAPAGPRPPACRGTRGRRARSRRAPPTCVPGTPGRCARGCRTPPTCVPGQGGQVIALLPIGDAAQEVFLLLHAGVPCVPREEVGAVHLACEHGGTSPTIACAVREGKTKRSVTRPNPGVSNEHGKGQHGGCPRRTRRPTNPSPTPRDPRARRAQQLLLGVTTPTPSKVGLCPFRLGTRLLTSHQVAYNTFNGDMRWVPTRDTGATGQGSAAARPLCQTRGSREGRDQSPSSGSDTGLRM